VALTPEGPGEFTQRSAMLQEISGLLRQRLEAENSTLVRDAAAFDELMRQAAYILGDVLARTEQALAEAPGEPDLGKPAPGAPAGAAEAAQRRYPDMHPAGEDKLFSVEIGTHRARRGIHPAESLRAATILFEVAFPVLVKQLAPQHPARAMSLGLALHEATMDRVALASLSYVDFLLEKLQASRQEERRRIARELHDRVSHGMGLALQNLDLYRYYAQREPERGTEKMTAAVGALGEVLRTVQQLSAELRRSVGTDGVQRALQAYVGANAPSSIKATIEFTGDPKTLPPNVSEELYLILREATRNVLRHADATRLRISVEISESQVEAEVIDDGRGFAVAATDTAPGGGLPSMAERAQLLHGTLDLDSQLGRGTRVVLRVPLTGGGR
jgi:signal transduction histidine kinase